MLQKKKQTNYQTNTCNARDAVAIINRKQVEAGDVQVKVKH